MTLVSKEATCLVLGAGGFLGRNLCLTLSAAGAKVIGFDKTSCPKELIPFVTWKTGDFSELKDYEDEAAVADVIFHLISTTIPGSSNLDITFDIDTNLKTTIQLLEYCRKSTKKIIYASSGGAIYGAPSQVPTPEMTYTSPISSYGIVKLAAEKYLYLFRHLYGLDYRVLRIANPFGPHQNGQRQQGAVASFMHKTLAEKPIEIWGDGEIVRDYIYIDDVMSAFIKVCEYRGEDRIFNIGSGLGVTLNQLVREISKVTGKNPEVFYREGRKTDVPKIILDISLAHDALGWKPLVPFNSALERTKKWMEESQP